MNPLKSVSPGRLLFFFMLYPVLISGSRWRASEHIKTSLIIYTAPFVEGIRTADMLLQEQADKLYHSIRLKRFGLNRQAFEYAWKGYTVLHEKRRLNNTRVLSICDFSQSSRHRRLY